VVDSWVISSADAPHSRLAAVSPLMSAVQQRVARLTQNILSYLAAGSGKLSARSSKRSTTTSDDAKDLLE
jgi:hypothetical protein